MRRFSIVLEPEPTGGYTVLVPALPGCVTHGQSVEQCVERAKEAIAGYIQSLEKHGEPIPIETAPPQVITVDVAA